jgi:hypothetical protein
MLTRICLGLALMWVAPLWSQVGSIPFEMPATSAGEPQMMTPPPVSGEAYPTTVGSDMRSNYLSAGLIFNTAYDDNVLAGSGSTPVGDFIYTISPKISLNQTTVRQRLALTYSPGFTFYQPTTTLDITGQNAAVNYQYRLSEHTIISLSDSFQKSSNALDQLYPSSGGGGISGSSQPPPVGVVAPYADMLNNTAYVGLSYQFSRNGMIGVSGNAWLNNYPDPAEASGLYNSNSLGGSIFYNHRLSNTQYAGVTYQYLKSQSNPATIQPNPGIAQTDTRTNALLAFYTIYLNPTFSLSLSVGPQHFDISQSPSQSFDSWSPSVTASIGWQSSHTNVVAGYSRSVSGALGLPGAFNSNSANASVHWQLARAWTLGAAGSFSNSTNVTPFFTTSNQGGRTASGSISVQHWLSEHLEVAVGYDRLYQSYTDIAVISADPDSNRGFVSLSYQLKRPLGR